MRGLPGQFNLLRALFGTSRRDVSTRGTLSAMSVRRRGKVPAIGPGKLLSRPRLALSSALLLLRAGLTAAACITTALINIRTSTVGWQFPRWCTWAMDSPSSNHGQNMLYFQRIRRTSIVTISYGTSHGIVLREDTYTRNSFLSPCFFPVRSPWECTRSAVDKTPTLYESAALPAPRSASSFCPSQFAGFNALGVLTNTGWFSMLEVKLDHVFLVLESVRT